MNITSIPDDLTLKKASPIQLFHYETNRACSKSKINLSHHTFSFLIEGTKEVITSNKSTAIENNNFLILKAGNCLMTERLSAANSTYKSILLFFSQDTLLAFLEKHKIDFPRVTNPDSFIVCPYDNYIQHFVQSLERITQLNTELQQQLVPTKFEEIMIYLVQQKGSEILNALLENHDDQTVHLINVVENNKLNKLSLQELSFLSNRSLSTFKRDFIRQYQTTPIKWFQEQRLAHAAFLLSTQKQRPREIFEDAGYETLSSFIQAFKKKYGSTPKQFQLEKMNF